MPFWRLFTSLPDVGVQCHSHRNSSHDKTKLTVRAQTAILSSFCWVRQTTILCTSTPATCLRWKVSLWPQGQWGDRRRRLRGHFRAVFRWLWATWRGRGWAYTCITDYISFCVEYTSPANTLDCYLNNKPWVTKDIKAEKRAKKRAFIVIGRSLGQYRGSWNFKITWQRLGSWMWISKGPRHFRLLYTGCKMFSLYIFLNDIYYYYISLYFFCTFPFLVEQL